MDVRGLVTQDDLSEEQRIAFLDFYLRVARWLTAETEAFHRHHPDIQIEWTWTPEVSRRESEQLT